MYGGSLTQPIHPNPGTCTYEMDITVFLEKDIKCLSFFGPLLEIINELIFVTNAMDVRNQDTGSVDRGRWPGVRDPGIFFLHVTHITFYIFDKLLSYLICFIFNKKENVT